MRDVRRPVDSDEIAESILLEAIPAVTLEAGQHVELTQNNTIKLPTARALPKSVPAIAFSGARPRMSVTGVFCASSFYCCRSYYLPRLIFEGHDHSLTLLT